MSSQRSIHPHFQYYLDLKEQPLIDLYVDLRSFILDKYPESNELLYHTHALTSLYSITEKMGDAFCLIPIYTNHLNLAFGSGTLVADPFQLLQGTGKLMRHIPIKTPADYRNEKVASLIDAAYQLALEEVEKPMKVKGETISKIKKV
ncbi:DUF1801 domain-containing protein [Fulvivirga sp.]|uniref:DUF1801 domain-containing protein n=1 Tax=Fulvivirga sp. TaxID=1931237 RepID=UPI0032EC03BC